jgi:serine/threonine-protein kinase
MIGRVLAGRYRLLSKLGQGGMGVVYKGEQISINRLTAIKILTPELASNSDFAARFHREARMASRINHPNAVAIYDFGEAEDGMIYLAMELVDGETLWDMMRRTGPLHLDRVVNITRQAALALEAAHQLGIVHRDFKPENVMICRSGRGDRAVVLDFGIAKETSIDSVAESLTLPGFILGTPRYMSPEQVKGETLDARSDLYSLATVAYEMLAGTLPFEAPTPQELMVKRVYEHPNPLLSSSPHLALPPGVEAPIMKALSRERDQRHNAVAEFAAELERAARLGVASDSTPDSKAGAVLVDAAVASASNRGGSVNGSLLSRERQHERARLPVRRRRRMLVLAAIVLASAAVVAAALLAPRFMTGASVSESLASSLRSAVVVGRLVTLSDDDAYSYYTKLRAQAPSHRALSEVAPRVLPQLRSIGEETFAKKAGAQPDKVTEQDWSKTLRAYEWARALSPADKALEARWRFTQAELARSHGKKDEAEQGYYAAASADTSWPLPHHSLGSLFIEKGDYAEAAAQFQSAINLQPDWDIPYNDLGTAYLRLMKYDTAAYWYRRALDVNPNWGRPHCGLGAVYEQKRMVHEALAEYAKALSVGSNGYSLTSNETSSIQQKIRRLRGGRAP